LLQFHSLNPENANWENPVQEWAMSEKAKEKYGSFSNMITNVSNEICQRNEKSGNITIASNLKNLGNYSV
jgi:hypothetical protein